MHSFSFFFACCCIALYADTRRVHMQPAESIALLVTLLKTGMEKATIVRWLVMFRWVCMPVGHACNCIALSPVVALVRAVSWALLESPPVCSSIKWRHLSWTPSWSALPQEHFCTLGRLRYARVM
jgi:hypothetical protein